MPEVGTFTCDQEKWRQEDPWHLVASHPSLIREQQDILVSKEVGSVLEITPEGVLEPPHVHVNTHTRQGAATTSSPLHKTYSWVSKKLSGTMEISDL